MTITKSFFSLAQNTLIRIKGILFVYALLSFVLCPLQIIFDLKNSNITADRYQTFDISILYVVVTIVMAFVLPLFAIAFMHNKKSATLFHSLPVSRTQIFFSNIFTVFLAYIIPVIATYGISAIIIFANFGIVKTVFSTLLVETVSTIVLGSVIISLVFLISSLSSSVLDTLLLSGLFSVIIPIIASLHNYFLDSYLFGYAWDYVEITMSKFSPVIYRMFIIREQSTADFLYIYILVDIVFVALAWFAYVKRKSEFAENQNLKGLIYKIVVILSSFLVPVAWATVFSYSQNSFVVLISCVAYSGITALLLCAIFSRNFKQNKHSVVTITISVLIPTFYVVMIIFSTGFGYEKYVPEISSVESVSIGELKSDYVYRYYSSYDKNIELTEEDSIQAVLDLHQLYVDSNGVSSDDNLGYVSFEVEYTLENNRIVTREYSMKISEEQLDLVRKIIDLDEYKKAYSVVQYVDAQEVVSLSILDAFNAQEQLLSLTQTEIEELFDAMAKDELELNYDTLYNENTEVFATICVSVGDEKSYATREYYITNHSENSIEVLKNLGYEDYTKRPSVDDYKAFMVTFDYEYYYSTPISLLNFYASDELLFKYGDYEISMEQSADDDSEVVIKEITDADELNAILDNVRIYSDEKTITIVCFLKKDVDISPYIYEYYTYDTQEEFTQYIYIEP